MYTTSNYTHADIIPNNHALRYCHSTAMLPRSNIDRPSQLINQPVKVEMYGILLKQQSKGISNYFGGYKTQSLIRDTEETQLMQHLFANINKRNYNAVDEHDFVVVDKFNLTGSQINFAPLKISNTNHKDTHKPKGDNIGFEELLKNRYQQYRKNFQETNADDKFKEFHDTTKNTKSTGKLYFSFVDHVQNKPLNHDIINNTQEHRSYVPSLTSRDKFYHSTAINTGDKNFVSIYESKAKNQKDTVSTHDSCTKTNVDRDHIDIDTFTKKNVFARVYSSKCFYEKNG